jgi:aminopeptidase N
MPPTGNATRAGDTLPRMRNNPVARREKKRGLSGAFSQRSSIMRGSRRQRESNGRSRMRTGIVLFACGGACFNIATSVAAPASARGNAPVVAVLTPADCPKPASVDVLEHTIDLALLLDPPALSGTGALRVRARRVTSTLTLDAHDLRVTEVHTGARALSFQQADRRIEVQLPEPLAAGAELVVQLAWVGATGGKTLHFAPGEVWAGYDAAAWMPTLQDPAQRATLSLRITTTEALEVVASGRRLGRARMPDGRWVHAFIVEEPTPPFLYAFAAGRFDTAELALDGITLRALGPHGADLKGALALTAPMYRFLREHTGAPLLAAEYTQVFVHGDAAQEAAGLSLISASALDDVRADPTDDWIFSHELAHQWFAWRVACADFADFWLNEGLATFLVGAIKEQRWGAAAYAGELRVWRSRSAHVHSDGRDAPLSLSAPGSARTAPCEKALQARGVTYFRGALTLHKLRGELGDAVFWEGLRRYVAERSGRGARSEDLRAAFEATSGRDLKPFFARWVYAPAPDVK